MYILVHKCYDCGRVLAMHHISEDDYLQRTADIHPDDLKIEYSIRELTKFLGRGRYGDLKDRHYTHEYVQCENCYDKACQ